MEIVACACPGQAGPLTLAPLPCSRWVVYGLKTHDVMRLIPWSKHWLCPQLSRTSPGEPGASALMNAFLTPQRLVHLAFKLNFCLVLTYAVIVFLPVDFPSASGLNTSCAYSLGDYWQRQFQLTWMHFSSRGTCVTSARAAAQIITHCWLFLLLPDYDVLPS
jgi:hypothetical protein